MADFTATDAHEGAAVREAAAGNLHCRHFQYTIATAITTEKSIAMGKVPAGATVMDGFVRWDASSADANLCVGDTDDHDRFVVDQLTTSAGMVRFVRGIPHQYDDETTLELQSDDAEVGDVYDLVVYYTTMDSE